MQQHNCDKLYMQETQEVRCRIIWPNEDPFVLLTRLKVFNQLKPWCGRQLNPHVWQHKADVKRKHVKSKTSREKSRAYRGKSKGSRTVRLTVVTWLYRLRKAYLSNVEAKRLEERLGGNKHKRSTWGWRHKGRSKCDIYSKWKSIGTISVSGITITQSNILNLLENSSEFQWRDLFLFPHTWDTQVFHSYKLIWTKKGEPIQMNSHKKNKPIQINQDKENLPSQITIHKMSEDVTNRGSVYCRPVKFHQGWHYQFRLTVMWSQLMLFAHHSKL